MKRTLSLLLFASSAFASTVDSAAHEVHAKIVYVGPTRELTSQSLEYIFDKTNPEARGKKVVLAEKGVPTYDVLPLTLGVIRGYTVKVELVAFALGPADSELAKRLLENADAVIFVGDSAPDRAAANQASLKQLKAVLAPRPLPWAAMPKVFQLDHRDLEGALPIATLKQQLGIADEPTVEAVSRTGVGVFDALKAATKLVLMQLRGPAPDAGAKAH